MTLMLLLACGAPDEERPVPLSLGAPGVVLPDLDGDGHTVADDCDDSDPTIHPYAGDDCDGIDNDCDGHIDEGVTTTFYADADGDGLGAGEPVEACEAPEGWVAEDGDCDDTDASLTEPETWYRDADADGHADHYTTTESCADPSTEDEQWGQSFGDCDDTDATVHPGAEEICGDGIDQDCDDADPECVFYDDCSAWAPFDQEGASWLWRSEGDPSYGWQIEAIGADTYDGLDVWLLSVEGSGGSYDGDKWDYSHETLTAEIAVTCETDGVHLVYENWAASYESHSSWSNSSDFIVFSSRPLWIPATLSVTDTWTVPSLRFPDDPFDHRDTNAKLTFTAMDEETVTVAGEEMTAIRVEFTQGTIDRSWWLVEGVGPVAEEGAYSAAVTALGGL